MKTYIYQVPLDPEPNCGFTVTVPVFPGCVMWAEDYDHAIVMAQEAIEGYLEVLAEEGKPIPEAPVTTPVDKLVQVKSPAVA